jgi:hypothetical protein
MGLLDQLSKAVGKQSGSGAQGPAENLHQGFDRVSQEAAPESIAAGLSHAFRSNETPPFGQMVSTLFRNGNPQQRTGLLSTLLSAAGPGLLGNFVGRSGGLGNLASAFQSGQPISEAHAAQVSPEEVEELASHSERQNPSVVDHVSGFSAQHPNLVKTLGSGALSVVMSKISGGHRTV